MRVRRSSRLTALTGAVALAMAVASPLGAHPDVTGDPDHDDDELHLLETSGGSYDPNAALEAHDAATEDVVSTGPSARVTKNLAVAGRGERLVPDATTDVWEHDGYAYIGTFSSPCGTGQGYGGGGLVQGREGPGIPVFDVRNPTQPAYVGNVPSVQGSRINDVKVASMNQGDVLVHSNESCDGGPGGFEVYDVDDPRNPVHLAHVQTDDINALLRDRYGYTDFGVHNLFLFTRDGRDYAAAQVEGLFGSFQVFDITDPADARLVTWFGAEYVLNPDVDWANTTDFDVINEGAGYLFGGFGASQNRFLHDHYVTPDGQRAYLANWDAGLLLVDLGELDGTAATLISEAIDPTSEDGEVNSHSVWPTADESIVVEGEEDFSPFGIEFSIASGPNAGQYPAGEFGWTVPIAKEYDDRTLSGPTVYGGIGCEEDRDQIPSPDVLEAQAGEQKILVLQRGDCFFSTKVESAQLAGYDAVIIPNHHSGSGGGANPDAQVCGSQGHQFEIEINALCTGHRVFHLLFNTEPAYTGDSTTEPQVGDLGERIDAEAVPNGWSGLRIWDYSDPENPVLASTFNTACSADPLHESCDPRGTYSSHNIIVEDQKAYVSWYSDGVLAVDVSDPYNPVEVARYHEAGPDFEERNGGIQDVWGVYKTPDEPWVYASDRNGGLYVLKEFGQRKGAGVGGS
jgi:hypothetical protein